MFQIPLNMYNETLINCKTRNVYRLIDVGGSCNKTISKFNC